LHLPNALTLQTESKIKDKVRTSQYCDRLWCTQNTDPVMDSVVTFCAGLIPSHIHKSNIMISSLCTEMKSAEFRFELSFMIDANYCFCSVNCVRSTCVTVICTWTNVEVLSNILFHLVNVYYLYVAKLSKVLYNKIVAMNYNIL